MGERGDQGFEVAPTRIGGSGGPARARRWRRVPIILVIAIAILVPTVAWIGPRIEWRPEIDLSLLLPTPTPVPSTTARPLPTPAPGLATPLPAITVGTGPHPTEPFAVDVGGVRLADPATGELGPQFELRGDTDAVFTSRDGDGWWCVCFARVPEADRETVNVEIRRVDSSGRVGLRRSVGEYRSAAPPPYTDFYTRFDLLVSADERTAYLSSATRTGDEWVLALEAIDLATGSVSARLDLGRVAVPSAATPTPPPDQGLIESYLAGPFMRMSPDGRRVLLWTWIDVTPSPGEPVIANPTGWMIDLSPDVADGSVGQPTPLGEPLLDRLRTCYWVAWTKGDELVAHCWWNGPSSKTPTLAVLDINGKELGRADLGSAGYWIAEPVLDRANRLVFLWQPGDHVLRRLDLDSMRIDELKVDLTATVVGPSGPGTGGDGALRPDWSSFTSDLNHQYYAPQLLAEPGTSRLFALGVDPDQGRARFNFGSSGVWVFDGTRLSLLDRWTPLAAYSSIGLSVDGRWLLAAGAPGSDADGGAANWEASVTVYDTSDGRPALQLGRLGTDVQMLQVPP